MDNFFIEYRDPLFSVIMLFFIIFIIAFVNYFWSVFKSKEEEQSIQRFIKKFEIAKEKDAYKELLDSFKLSSQTLSLLAHSYIKSGDYESAISIYLIALKQVKAKEEKQYILLSLAKAYFKAGFLQRSADVFMELLRISPRHKEALKYMIVCYETLKEYELAFEALNALEELGVLVKEQKAYIRAKAILSNDKLEIDKKLNLLEELQSDFVWISRMVVEFRLLHGLFETKHLHVNNPLMLFDIVWFLDDDEIDFTLLDERLYQSIASAKGLEGFSENSHIFELEVLQKLHQSNYHKAVLNFEFTCKECKHTFPMFFYRCPNCHSLGEVEINPILSNKNNETYIPFL